MKLIRDFFKVLPGNSVHKKTRRGTGPNSDTKLIEIITPPAIFRVILIIMLSGNHRYGWQEMSLQKDFTTGKPGELII